MSALDISPNERESREHEALRLELNVKEHLLHMEQDEKQREKTLQRKEHLMHRLAAALTARSDVSDKAKTIWPMAGIEESERVQPQAQIQDLTRDTEDLDRFTHLLQDARQQIDHIQYQGRARHK